MRNTPLPGLYKKSPIRKDEDIDTTWADKVYDPQKVDEHLIKKGYHTQGDLRGKKDTTPTAGANVGSGSQMMNLGV